MNRIPAETPAWREKYDEVLRSKWHIRIRVFRDPTTRRWYYAVAARQGRAS